MVISRNYRVRGSFLQRSNKRRRVKETAALIASPDRTESERFTPRRPIAERAARGARRIAREIISLCEATQRLHASERCSTLYIKPRIISRWTGVEFFNSNFAVAIQVEIYCEEFVCATRTRHERGIVSFLGNYEAWYSAKQANDERNRKAKG